MMISKDDTEREELESESGLQSILSDFSQFYILLMLSEGPAHGYRLIKDFRRRTGGQLSPGTLYPFLQKLENRGVIIHTDQSVGKRPKIVYSLTEEGITFCERLFKRFAAITVSAIEPRLETCANCGCRIYSGSYHETIKGVKRAFCCSHCAAAFKSEINKHSN